MFNTWQNQIVQEKKKEGNYKFQKANPDQTVNPNKYRAIYTF